MGIVVGNLALPGRVLLAPMAGITDLPFRDLVQRFGAALVVSEMVLSGELLAARRATRARLATGTGTVSVQIAGREPGPVAEAARIAEGEGAAIVDLNMGCPAKKVTGGWSGSALMREPARALALVEAVVAAVTVPVTVKMRLGWDRGTLNAPDLARRAEAAGVAMIAVHGRTRCEFYEGRADWAAIRAVAEAVRIPVVANGDVTDAASARAALAASGAAAVMVGRGAQGRPWAVAAIEAALAGAAGPPVPAGAALAALVAEHYEALLGFYGIEVGVRVARKHLGWYLAAAGRASARARLLGPDDPRSVLAALPDAFADAQAGAAAGAAPLPAAA